MSRFARLRTPLLAAAAATTVSAGGLIAYSQMSRTPTITEKALVDVRRDPSTGAIIPPSFPAHKSRAEHLADLRRRGAASTAADDEYDLLVIGGGATGTGIALDAATRGLRVALVERDDFSSGTSSKSTKLVHGGVRYLEKAVMNLDYPQLALVMEALHERKTFLEIAPHLSSSLPILLPLHKWWQAPYFWAGTKAYDVLAGSQGLESSYYMTRSAALEAFPLLKKDNLKGALVYYDGQHNDSRMNVSLALTASMYGVTVVNHAEVTELTKDESGRISGAMVRDVMAGEGQDEDAKAAFKVAAKGVINATGPFSDAIERMDEPSRKPIVAPSAGAHIMLPRHLSPKSMGILDAATSDGRVVFVLPWEGATLAGTTDSPCAVEREPVAKEDEVDFILREVGKLLSPETTLTRKDVLAAWSGIRPLVKDPKAKNTESLVRSHLVTVSPSGLLTCAGGKWTTYRQMAEDAVDEAIAVFGLAPRAGVAMPDISGHRDGAFAWTTDGKCKTRHVPLVGAHGFSTSLAGLLVSAHGLDADVAHHLATNYGDRAWEVLAASKDNKDANTTTKRLAGSFPFIEGEVLHAVRAESAMTATDVLARRTRLAFLDVNAALDALPRVVDVMAAELGWTPARAEAEWTSCVSFLRSMGLPAAQVGVTRAEVLAGKHREGAAVGSTGEAAGRHITGGLPEQTFGGAVMARDSSA